LVPRIQTALIEAETGQRPVGVRQAVSLIVQANRLIADRARPPAGSRRGRLLPFAASLNERRRTTPK
jgi:hypothetical protein